MGITLTDMGVAEMTNLIPRDAAIAAVYHADSFELSLCGTSRIEERIELIPTIDPAAIREAALEACTIIDAAVKEGHENPLDLILHLLSAGEPARRALALIGEKK